MVTAAFGRPVMAKPSGPDPIPYLLMSSLFSNRFA